MGTGELKLFQEIWATRPRRSEVSGDELPYFSVDCFSHILTKGAYPAARLDPDNIMLMTGVEHVQWEVQRWKCEGDPRWDKVYDRQLELKRKYL